MAINFLRTYSSEIKDHLDYLVTWPINTDVQLGDIGILEDGVFKRMATLKALGITQPGEREGRGTSTLEYGSRNGVEWTLNPGASTAVQAIDAKVEIKFTQEGAVFLRIGDYTLKQFETTDELGQEILTRYKNDSWQRNRVVVTEVVSAAAATVLVSGSNGALASFSLDASLPAAEALSKGKFSGLLGLSGSFAAQVIGEHVSPLFRTCGLRRRFLRSTIFRGETSNGDPGDLMFGRVDSSEQLKEE